ncbi:alpha/beta hydrolase [Nocardioides sp. Bht2]|uniref:alpha/beta hydrolase n=1 Tax=Nocardioides sp. Bht2 TaxID=3392297 RepID=UPI0039B5220C
MRLHNWSAPGLSLRSRITMDVLAATWRPLTAVLPSGRLGTLISRKLIAGGLAFASPPVRGATFTPVEQPSADGPIVRGEWVRTPATDRTDGVVLYIHGSGYVVCSARTHRGLTSQIAARTGHPVFSIDYRLAPNNAYPAAPQDVRAAWDWLLAQGHDPSRIVVAGDSAGGHLALTLVLGLARAHEPLPAAVVTLSPVIDLDLARSAVRDRVEHDPFASPHVARRVMAHYADDAARSDEGLRIAFDDIDAFPPTLVHAGSREMLAADCTELARRIRAAGFPVEHRVWPGLMHVFQAMTALMPESNRALDEIADFIGVHLTDVAQSPVAATIPTQEAATA